MSNSTQNDWESRYEEFITFVTNEKNWIDGRPVWKEYKYVTLANAIKHFIRQELADARKEERQKIRDMLNFTLVTREDLGKNEYVQGYNSALNAVLATLREEETSK